MESDSQSKKRLNELEIEIIKKRNNTVSNDINVFQSNGIRHFIQASNGVDRFLLDYGCNFLLPFTIVSWVIFFITS